MGISQNQRRIQRSIGRLSQINRNPTFYGHPLARQDVQKGPTFAARPPRHKKRRSRGKAAVSWTGGAYREIRKRARREASCLCARRRPRGENAAGGLFQHLLGHINMSQID
jgi:hypothetical protein